MKIAKNSIQTNSTESVKKYDAAIKSIRKAIDSLASSGKDDEVAREAINNLSVILFDLQD